MSRGSGHGIAAVLVGCAACSGAPHAAPTLSGLSHAAGTSFAEVRAHHGIPILQRSFFWDGNGEVDDSGVGVHAATCLDDHWAVGVGANLATWWTAGRDVHSLEAETLVRLHPFADLPVFVQGTGGYQLADDQIPPGGTVWNFTFSFGGGVEAPLAEHSALLAGIDYHHISNALGRDNERNPSQNEARLWIGIGWTF